HKDCSLGRHSYECCSLTVGISVTGADEVSGQLRVRAGSHRALMWSALDQPGCDLPVVDLPTRTGDVTVHLSCTLHMAQPPVERAGVAPPPRWPPRRPPPAGPVCGRCAKRRRSRCRSRRGTPADRRSARRCGLAHDEHAAVTLVPLRRVELDGDAPPRPTED